MFAVVLQVHADSVIEIQQLDHSPSMTNKFRQTQHQLQLQHELNLQQQREEVFIFLIIYL